MHRCVTRFMLDTCRYTENDMLIPFESNIGRFTLWGDDYLLSGSTAEFYIRPQLSCIGDMDIMSASIMFLAIPHGHSPPTKLPSYYDVVVRAVEMIDSDQPGYVFLRFSHVLWKIINECYFAVKSATGRNEAVFVPRYTKFEQSSLPQMRRIWNDNDDIVNMLFRLEDHTEYHGPAWFNTKISDYVESTRGQLLPLCLDYVPTVRCFVWPPQASSWPTRNRDYDWPDAATINMVVTNGCDVVPAVHPNCRQNEWASKYQWRLSFSQAEVTLINSWSPVQQIIYHMLRFVMKRTVFTEECDKDPNLPKLCNYHIKTLMLWECEQKPQSWWSAESSLIKLCSSLLHKLSDCVEIKRFQQYFITDCNLLDHFTEDGASLIASIRLRSLADKSLLLSWFVENYVRKCAQCFPKEVSILFEDINSSDKLETAVDAAIDWGWLTQPQESHRKRYSPESMILSLVRVLCVDATVTPGLIKLLQNFAPHLREYSTALISLHVAYTISIHSLTEDSLEMLWTLASSSNTALSDMTNSGFDSGRVEKAAKLASTSNIGSTALDMLYNEISKAYLHQSLKHGQESTYCVVHVLLAALYYKSGHYQSAIDHCKQVLNQTACEQYGLRSIGAEYLPQIDETVDAVSGVISFYRHVQRNALKCDRQPQTTVKAEFTLELLAHYLYSQCSGVRSPELLMYRRHLIETDRPLVSDVLLFNTVQIQQLEETEYELSRPDNIENCASTSMDTTLLVTTLELVALEKLIAYRQVMIRDLNPKQHDPVVNEFEVLYAYKCGSFEECLEMCRNNVYILLSVGCTQMYSVEYPEFLCLLDGELVSLCGLFQLLCPGSTDNYPEYSVISTVSLSLYLMAECQKKLLSDCVHETLRLILLLYKVLDCASGDDICLEHLVLRMTYRSLKLYAESRLADELT